MKFTTPNIFSNQIDQVGLKIQEELRDLIVAIKKYGLTDTDYTFKDNDVEVNIVEVCVVDEGGKNTLSFAVEEIDGDDSYTVWADNIDTHQLLSLYNLYYANNNGTLKGLE